jgi:hypothetical protein
MGPPASLAVPVPASVAAPELLLLDELEPLLLLLPLLEELLLFDPPLLLLLELLAPLDVLEPLPPPELLALLPLPELLLPPPSSSVADDPMPVPECPEQATTTPTATKAPASRRARVATPSFTACTMRALARLRQTNSRRAAPNTVAIVESHRC